MTVLKRLLRLPPWALIGVVAAAVWWGSLDNNFHYDDEHSILLNIHLRIAPGAADLVGAVGGYFSDPATFSRDHNKGMYRPLLVTSFALNHAFNLAADLDGYDVRSYHIINVIIHTINAVLLWWMMSLLWPRWRGSGPGLVAGLIFLVWPLASEPVNYISSRSESLASLFYLLSLCLFLLSQQRGGARWRWGCWAAMAAGLMTKSTVITLPAALLLIDLTLISQFNLRRLAARLWRWHVPGIFVAAGYLCLIVLNGFLGRSLGAPVREAWPQALTQLKGLGYYLQLLSMPTHLSVEPQFSEQTTLSPTTVVGFLLAASLGAGLVWLWHRRHGRALALVGIAILHMLPTMVMPLNVFVNERRAYLPLALACVGVVSLACHFSRRLPWHVFVPIALLVAAAMSFERNRVWADGDSLWADAVMRAPQMPRPHLYLGNAYKDRALRTRDESQRNALWAQAAAQYERTLTMQSDVDLQVRALNNLGGVHFERGDIHAAERAFRRAVKTGPNYADGLINLGNALLKRGTLTGDSNLRGRLFQESVDYYRRGLTSEPNNYFGHGNLGVAMQELGRWDEAESSFRQALYLFPRHDGSLTNLSALLLTRAERTEDAGKRVQLLKEAEHLVRQSLAINPAQVRAPEVLRRVSAGLGAASQASGQAH
ncbi:MAG: tetratricopeptide repeat protein [Gemmatimonadetes bacterium]|nr:tetratricopeptide repeat protein [Gemmatimonadota bacterium]MBT6145573.1 tetratricopeptide repeat protein [Gemmatimonadota bacterium]